MKVFLTGATGFIGTHLIPELLASGHHVTGLTRSDSGADLLARAGADAVRGDVGDPAPWLASVAAADGVIHAAFDHDFSQLARHSANDRAVIETLAAVLAGSDRPLVVSSGTGLARSGTGSAVVETDGYAPASQFPRGATEEAADAAAAAGTRAIVVRLAQVHDPRHQGRIAQHVELGRRRGRVAYVGDGANRVPAVHVTDAARLFRRAFEDGRAGARYHAVAEEGIPMRDIAQVIGTGLGVPVDSIGPEDAPDYFGWMAPLVAADLAARSDATRSELSWTPTGTDFLTDLRAMDYR